MIYYFSPYSLEGNLGKAYNDYMQLLPNDDDWACITDGDVMFLTSNYGKQLQDIVNVYKDHNVGLFTCLTNRVGNLEQCYNGYINDDGEIRNHRKIAIQLQKEKYFEVSQIHKIISGHLMLIQKRVWNEIKFKEEGILSVDNNFSFKLLKNNYMIYLMQGVYVMHYYRMIEGRPYKDHLKNIT